MNFPNYPAQLEVAVPEHLPSAIHARLPGSKSLTNRALLMAALCQDAPVILLRPTLSEDTQYASEALRKLGVRVEVDESGERWRVDGTAGLRHRPNQPRPELFLGNSGTSTRFLLSVVAGAGIGCRIDGTARMRERPIGPLISALNQLGGDVHAELDNDCPPIVVQPQALKGGEAKIAGDVSSQFLSGLLMGAPLAAGDSVIRVDGEWLSRPYIEMTMQLLGQFGIETRFDGGPDTAAGLFVRGGQRYASPGTLAIEPDASGASYPLVLGALHRVPVTVEGLGDGSLQGDVRVVDYLGKMGLRVVMDEAQVSVHPPASGQPLQPLGEVNLKEIPDAAMTLLTLAAATPGRSQLRGLRNLAFKECDRLQAMTTELNKLGACVKWHEDGYDVEGIAPADLQSNGEIIHTYDDHRVAMCLALLGTLCPGTVIDDPGCVAKTYPGFWHDLAAWLETSAPAF